MSNVDRLLTTSVMNLQTGGVAINVKTSLADGVHEIDGVTYLVLTVQRRMEQVFRDQIDSGTVGD